ncbi:MAG: hypothetical protein PHF46_01625 [Candidatus Gracilibacteria bacterium]|nr:hypothetical protein [Candidatus Gracilibacteria bacterium]MDD3120090.1 hypothetical protein [Candidatus Gracilibacteria bacterium]MDD4530212.1 hypothetical protein [Candidatus Gracilibacteria bacterium]
MNQNFIQYFTENFFQNKPEELDLFLKSLGKTIKKTIRINTNKIIIKDFESRFKKKGYILSPTFISNVFYAERGENFTDPEKRLGFSLEHLLGYFYIQELGASSSVHYLTEGKIDKNPYLILDMASSPGGKTTQLAEHYPNSFIVGNEFDKGRLAQLISNVERMGSDNVGLTYYNGLFFGKFTETFDRILLDAPCSGEGVGFKVQNNLKYWNIKNTKKIAELQSKLLEAALNSLKIGGEMLYSTCTLNKEENENVVNGILSKHPNCFEIMFEKRFWPHIDNTGGFFVCKIKKLKSINYKIKDKEITYNTYIKPLNKKENEILSNFCRDYGLDLKDYILYIFKQEVLAIKNVGNADMHSLQIQNLIKKFYLIKLGKKIGRIEGDKFVPNFYLGRDFELKLAPKYEIKDKKELDFYLKGNELIVVGNADLHSLHISSQSEFYQIKFANENIGLGSINKETGKIRNVFPVQWLRR